MLFRFSGSQFTVQGSQFTVHSSRLVALRFFSISIILCIAEYISLTPVRWFPSTGQAEPTGDTENKYLIIFFEFLCSIFFTRGSPLLNSNLLLARSYLKSLDTPISPSIQQNPNIGSYRDPFSILYLRLRFKCLAF